MGDEGEVSDDEGYADTEGATGTAAAAKLAEAVRQTAKLYEKVALPALPGIAQLDQWFYKVQDAMARA
eukprot:3484521-Lingulodinium_polyedra.AAC.1